MWEGVYCHELTSNLEIICDLYVQAHPKRDYKTKLLSCLRWKLLFTTLDDVTTCSYSEILNSSSRRVLTSKTKFLRGENKRYYFLHLSLSTYIVFIHIHLTEISRETVPYFNLYFNLNLFTLSFSNEFETAKWCGPLLQKIIMPGKWRKLLILLAACWRLQFCE